MTRTREIVTNHNTKTSVTAGSCSSDDDDAPPEQHSNHTIKESTLKSLKAQNSYIHTLHTLKKAKARETDSRLKAQANERKQKKNQSLAIDGNRVEPDEKNVLAAANGSAETILELGKGKCLKMIKMNKRCSAGMIQKKNRKLALIAKHSRVLRL